MLGLGLANGKYLWTLFQRTYFFSSTTFTLAEESASFREAIFVHSGAELCFPRPRAFGSPRQEF